MSVYGGRQSVWVVQGGGGGGGARGGKQIQIKIHVDDDDDDDGKDGRVETQTLDGVG